MQSSNHTGRDLRTVLFRSAGMPQDAQVVRAADADAVILDLEASVRPNQKAAARDALSQWLRDPTPMAGTVAVRINDPCSAEAAQDLRMLADIPGFDAVVVPQVASLATLDPIAQWATSLRREKPIQLWAMIETPLAVQNLQTWGRRVNPLSCLIIGYKDLALAIGVDFDPRQPVLRATARAVLAAAGPLGISVIDGPACGPPEMVRSCIELAKKDGFDGVALLYPALVQLAKQTSFRAQ